jgi:hypothetical protein
MKNLNITPTRVGDESKQTIESYLPTGTEVRSRAYTPLSEAQPGDMIVRYQGAQIVATNYRRAIRTLELPEAKEERYISFYEIDAMRSELAKMIDDIKLWNYAPRKREEVKAARAYLHQVLESSAEYGTESVILQDEIKGYFDDAGHNFAVAEYYYCVGDIVLPSAGDAKVALAGMAENVVEHLRDTEARLLATGREKLEGLTDIFPLHQASL